MPEIYKGIAGNIKAGATTPAVIAHMSGWNLNLSRDIGEIVSFGDDYKEKTAGVKDWSADLDGTADFTTAGGQDVLLAAYEAGTALVYGFYLSATKYFEGTGIIESIEISQAAEDAAATVSMSVAGSGGVTLEVGI